MAFNLVQIRELPEKKDDELDLIESGPNEVGGHVYAGGAGDPRQFAVSLSLSPDHSMDANFEREWERLRSAFVDILLPSLGARDLRETNSTDA